MADASLLHLPNEFVAHLLEHTDFKCLVALRLTCRRMRDLIAGSASLQYTLALAALGMRAGSDAESISIREKLERLQAYNAAWAADAKLAEFARFTSPDDEAYICGNHMLLVSSNAPEQHTIHVYQMPAPLCGVEFRRWEVDIDIPFTSLCTDPTQDLLLLGRILFVDNYAVKEDIHVLSMSTGQRYPLSLFWSGQLEMRKVIVGDAGISGDRVANIVMTWDGDHGGGKHVWTLVIWNWKTGKVEARSGPSDKIVAIKFLDESHILTMTGLDPASNERFGSHFQVHTLHGPAADASDNEEGIISLCRRFRLPEEPAQYCT